MSGDESFIQIISIILAVIPWYLWYAATRVRALAIRNVARSIFVVAPPVRLVTIFLVLGPWAADDVRCSETSLPFRGVAGAAWVGLCALWLGFLVLAIPTQGGGFE